MSVEKHTSIDLTQNEQEWYLLFEDCIDLAVEIKHSIELKKDEHSKIIYYLFFSRMVNTARGISFLIEKNLLVESYVLIRHLMETLFLLKGSCKDDNILKNYIGSDEIYRKIALNTMPKGEDIQNPGRHLEVNMEADKEVDKIKEFIAENKIKKVDFEAIAKKVGLDWFYQVFYRKLSCVVHSGIRSLAESAKFNDEKQVTRIHDKPYRNELDQQLYLINVLLYISIDCMMSNFLLEAKADSSGLLLKERFAKLDANLSKKCASAND